MFVLRPSRPAQPLVLRVDLSKARTKGAVAADVSGGKYGKIIKLLDGSVWRLEQKHVARLGEITKYFHEHNIPFIHIPPGQKISRDKINVAGLGAQSVVKEKPVIPPVLPEVPSTEAAPVVDAVAAIRERVANWKTPSKFRHAIDPKLVVELKLLQRRRRTIGNERRALQAQIAELKEAKPKGYKGLIRELREQASKDVDTYAQAGYRIRAIMGTSHATAGGGMTTVTNEAVANVAALPHADLGFDVNQKPMSYLLSLGWDTKTPKGENKFSKREFDALVYEYDRFMNRNVADLVKKYLSALGVAEYKPGSEWGDTKRPKQYKQKYREWQAEAKTVLYDLAAHYASNGSPSESNNFALYVHSVLPQRLARMVKKDVGVGTGKVMFMGDDIDAVADAGPYAIDTKKRVPGTKAETPEQALTRRELETSVAKILGATLTPLESAVVSSRLNFAGEREGTYSDKKNKFTVGVDLQSWKTVRENVVSNLKEFIKDDMLRREAKARVNKMTETSLSKVFDGAIAKLRQMATPDKDGARKFTSEQVKDLTELATLKRLYLEGQRHETWNSNEGFSKLIVRRDLPKEETTRVTTKRVVSDKAVRQFWDKQKDLAHTLALDTHLYSRFQPNVAVPKMVEADKARAFEYFRIVQELRQQTPGKLQRMILKQAEPAPRQGKYRNMLVPQSHFQTLMQHVLDEKLKAKAKGSVTKSLVILDCGRALDALLAESRLWDMNNGVLH